MSAQVLDFADFHIPSGPPVVGERPRLVLVPEPAPEVPREVHYRLTRRGRRVVAFLLALVVSVLGVATAGRIASAAGQPHTITVQSGQTLSEIALSELPGVPVREGVVTLQLTNGLSSDQVRAGDQLVIPAR